MQCTSPSSSLEFAFSTHFVLLSEYNLADIRALSYGTENGQFRSHGRSLVDERTLDRGRKSNTWFKLQWSAIICRNKVGSNQSENISPKCCLDINQHYHYNASTSQTARHNNSGHVRWLMDTLSTIKKHVRISVDAGFLSS